MTLSDFLTSFVQPLVAGGDLHVGEPLEMETVLDWETQLSGADTADIDEARAARAAELLVRPPTLAFGEEELRLAAALYDALALAHPASDGFSKRRARGRLADTAVQLATVDPPETRGEVLARHTLLHNLYWLRRTDTRVSWWTGKAEFRGQEPPTRLLWWRSVRRVREERTDVPLADILADDARRATLAALAAASPLTDALSLDAPNRLPFSWHGKRILLQDAELARAVAYEWVPDLTWDDALATAAAAAVAFRDAWGKLPGADARAVLAFFVHLAAVVAMAELGFPDVDAPSPLLTSALKDPDGGAALVCALPNAAARIEPPLGAPPGVADDPRLARRFRAHRLQVEKALTGERLRELALRLRTALRVIP